MASQSSTDVLAWAPVAAAEEEEASDNDDNDDNDPLQRQQDDNDNDGEEEEAENAGLRQTLLPFTTASRSTQWSLVLFSVTTVLLFADQNLMAPNLTAIAHDFGFNDEERDRKLGGEIALCFFVLGAPASYVVGCLGDHWNRSILFAITVGIGEGACMATAFCQTYRQFYAARAITGFSLGGALPLIYSVTGDLFIARQRHMVGAAVGAGTGMGIMLGQSVAGFVGPTFGWRLPFLIISIPALVCAALVLLTVQDPERGSSEEATIAIRQQQQQEQQQQQYDDDILNNKNGEDHTLDSRRGNSEVFLDEPDTSDQGLQLAPMSSTHRRDSRRGSPDHLYHQHTGEEEEEEVQGCGQMRQKQGGSGTPQYWATFKRLLSTRTVILCLLQGAPGCVPWGIVNTYLNDFLSENKGLTIEMATSVALVFGLGNFFGLMLGGAGGSYLYEKDKRFPSILAGGTAVASCFPFWFLINLKNAAQNAIIVFMGAFLLGFLSGSTGPIVKATLQNVTLPQARGQAFALFNTFDDFGRGLGPVFVAALITNLGSRQAAFNVGIFGWALCGIVNLLAFFTVEADERHVQLLVSAQLTGAEKS